MKRTCLMMGGLLMVASGLVQAAEDRGGQMAFFLDAPFSNNPGYNIGGFVTDSTLLYGSVHVRDSDTLESQSLGFGARFYNSLVEAENLNSYWDVSVDVGSQEASAPNSPATTEQDTLALSGHFGLEFFVSESASIGARVGVRYTDMETDNQSTDFTELGDASVQLNLYW